MWDDHIGTCRMASCVSNNTCMYTHMSPHSLLLKCKCLSSHSGVGSVFPPSEPEWGLGLLQPRQSGEGDTMLLPRLGHKNDVASTWRSVRCLPWEPSPHSVRKAKHGESCVERSWEPSLSQHHPLDLWVNSLQIIPTPSFQDPRHYGAEVSRGRYAPSNSWPSDYMRITNGCFTTLNFRVIYYTAIVRWFAMCQNLFPMWFQSGWAIRGYLLGDFEGGSQVAAIYSSRALLLMCWCVGIRQLWDLCLLFWAHMCLASWQRTRLFQHTCITKFRSNKTQHMMGTSLSLSPFQFITIYSSWLPAL